MQKAFYIIMGKPGAGKGTQAQLLKAHLEKTLGDVRHVTTGGAFREFFKRSDSYVAAQARKLQDEGGLQPEFIAIWNWSQVFINELGENTSVILDGAPRKVVEVEAMHDVFPFLGYAYPPIIHVDVSDEWARDRQLYRESHSEEKRADAGSVEEVNKRLGLFQEEIVPCIELFKKDPRYTYVRINGEQTVEEVHAEILKKLHEIGH